MQNVKYKMCFSDIVGLKMMEKEKLEIRVVLEDEVKQRFLVIKKRKGIKNNSEVLRYLISEYGAQENRGAYGGGKI